MDSHDGRGDSGKPCKKKTEDLASSPHGLVGHAARNIVESNKGVSGARHGASRPKSGNRRRLDSGRKFSSYSNHFSFKVKLGLEIIKKSKVTLRYRRYKEVQIQKHDCCPKEGERFVTAATTGRGKTIQESPGKQIHNRYTVTSIPGDGRCLFRAVAHGLLLRCGNGAPDERQQAQMADDLRQKVADELVKRRNDIEWLIEGRFEDYVYRIRQPQVWGGEPELLMLTEVLKVPINVFLKDKNTKRGIIKICKYGQVYGADNPILVLYDGRSHYEALQIHVEENK